MSYRITIERSDDDHAIDSPECQLTNVYKQTFEDLDVAGVIRKLNEPTRKPRADRGKTRKGAALA